LSRGKGGVLYNFIDNDEWALEAIREIKYGKDYGIDTETQGLDPYLNKLLLIQVGTRDNITIFDARKISKNIMRNYLEILFESANSLILHNAKFDFKMLMHNYNVVPPKDKLYDTQLMEGVSYNGLRKPDGKRYAFESLASLAKKYLNVELEKESRNLFIDYDKDFFTDEMLEYAAKDIEYLFDIASAQQYFLIKNEMEQIARLENDLIPATAQMELTGVVLDVPKWLGLYHENIERQKRKLEEIQDIVKDIKVFWPGVKSAKPKEYDFSKDKFNPGSWQQTLAILYARGVKTTKKSYKNGKEIISYEELDSSDSKILEKLDDKIAKLIIEYRGIGKLASSYGINIIELIHPVTGRLHGQFNQVLPDSGRFSAENPNLQNIPIRNGNEKYRACFTVPKGRKQVNVDFSNVEMRLAGEFSGDETIIQAYLNNEDLHSLTASAMYNVPLEEVTKEQRANGKTFNFAVLYGAEAYRVSLSLEIPIKEAEILVANWRNKFSKLAAYLNETAAYLKEHGYVKTYLGRRRYFDMPSPNDPNYRRLLSAHIREACNHPIQGTSADMTKIAIINIFYRIQGYDAKLIRTVHDEIAVECAEEIAESIKNIMVQEMIKAGEIFLKIIPVKVDPKISDTWEH
jgi:DNA polymerase-1